MVTKRGFKISDLRVYYDSAEGKVSALSGFNQTLQAPSITYLLGRNGSGKSTLFKAITGELLFNGDFFWNGQKANSFIKEIAFCYPQDIDSITPFDVTVSELFLAFGISGDHLEHIFSRETYRELRSVEKIHNRMLSQLSGGQRQLILWAATLGNKGNILLVDEALRSMDHSIKELIWRDLEEITEQRKCVTIVITHDLNFIVNNPKDVIVMKNGISTELISTSAVSLTRLEKALSN
ncbi:ATP-binding cassette domain-containing protein [Planctobacterium marinum]|uniref:ATP-binding cassette domain-containing protein n=1 Tax=Planctobacterium marinum TaxID=1631968 RepID=UPI001E4BCD2D|nr:ATP-binding cassette domain-containing protein [Planctobacterium marinum]MCC2607141.1 ATP-binding cassette domain-containing protein [Planctobacterium marinum]